MRTSTSLHQSTMPSGPQSFVEHNHNNDYHYHGQHLITSQLPSISANSYFAPTADSSERERLRKPMDSPDTLNDLKLKAKGLSAQHRKERERLFSNTPVEALIQKLIEKEFEARETKKLLRTAIVRLEATTQRAVRAEQECKKAEAAQTLQNLNVSQGMIDSQQKAEKAQQDIAVYKLQLDHMRQEVRRAQAVVKNVEDERDDAKCSASKARAVARKLNDERLVLFAREEGRRQGYEEGMQQGRLAILTAPHAKYITARAHDTPLGSGAAFIEDYEDASSSTGVGESKEHITHQSHHHPDIARGMHSTHGSHGTGTRRTPRPRHAFLDSAPRGRSRVLRSGAASQLNTPHNHPRHVQVNESHGPQVGGVGASSQDSALRRELETAKEQAEALKRQLEQREAIRTYEAQQAEHMEKEREAERGRIKAREAELEREREELQEKERQREAEKEREMKLIRERDAERERERKKEREVARERERELEEQSKREREAREREERERERERQQQKEREREKVDKERRPPPRLPYLPMPPPPAGVVPSPLIPPSQSQSTAEAHASPTSPRQPQQFQPDLRRRRRRTSDTETTRSPSSSASVSQLDIITFPSSSLNVRSVNGNERGDETDWVRPHGLPDIPEATESRTSVATASPPRWLHNPPVDLMKQALRGKDPADVESWRRSTSDHAAPTTYSPSSSEFLSPGYQPRGRVYQQPKSTDLRRTPSSSSSNVDIIIVPPSRPPSPSGASHQHIGEIAGYLSPKHGPEPLPIWGSTQQPVTPEFISAHAEPPPGFVAFSPHTAPIGGNGTGNGLPRPRSPIYSGMPLTTSTSTWSSRDSAPATPRQIYGAPFVGAGQVLGLGQPVIPSPPRDGPVLGMGMGTPHHRPVLLDGGGRATPATRIRDLPPASGSGGAVTLNGSLPSHNSPYKFSSMSYPPPEDEDDEGDEDDATRRNTLANANAGALPIPPPSFQKRW